jgi:hypothetical protein
MDLHLIEYIVGLIGGFLLGFFGHLIDDIFAGLETLGSELSSDAVLVILDKQDARAVRPGNQLDAVRLEIGMLNVGIAEDPNLNHGLLAILLLRKERLERVHSGTRSAHDLAKDVDIDTSRV